MKLFDVIVARSVGDRAIGKNGAIPWILKEDLRWFRERTVGHVLIMGRRTWDSLPIKPLPNRVSVVLTHSTSNVGLSGCHTAHSLESAMTFVEVCYPLMNVFIIGGEGVYREALGSARCRAIYETVVDLEVEGATAFFPEIKEDQYRLVEEKGMYCEEGLRYWRRTWRALNDALDSQLIEEGE